ncbi:hypothetical protein [Spiroplasma endosymbiont of Virgichneumon dumeticola]|uniref:hypothetical protein n=1 Tax=Spiroplasma endosymbiont of Virgichneumon dumeticola TaxID=3139323 RepID=UPI0035C885E5
MIKSNFKFSKIFFYNCISLSIIHCYNQNNVLKIISELNSVYLIVSMIFIVVFLVYLSKINQKIKILSLKIKKDLQIKGKFNYLLLIVLIVLLVHFIIILVLKISFINNISQTLSPLIRSFLIINLAVLLLSVIFYTFLVNFSNFISKLYKKIKINISIKKSFQLFLILIKKIKLKLLFNLKSFTLKLLINFKVNYILVNALQWLEIFRKSQKLNNTKKACAPGIIPVFNSPIVFKIGRSIWLKLNCYLKITLKIQPKIKFN